MYIKYISVSKPTQRTVAGPHGQLASKIVPLKVLRAVDCFQTPDNSYSSETTSPLASSFTSGMSINTSFTSGNLPYDKSVLLIYQPLLRSYVIKTQHNYNATLIPNLTRKCEVINA